MSETKVLYKPRLEAYNRAKKDAASGRWKAILELSKGHSAAEIAAIMGLTRQRVTQLLAKAEAYFGQGDGQRTGTGKAQDGQQAPAG